MTNRERIIANFFVVFAVVLSSISLLANREQNTVFKPPEEDRSVELLIQLEGRVSTLEEHASKMVLTSDETVEAVQPAPEVLSGLEQRIVALEDRVEHRAYEEAAPLVAPQDQRGFMQKFHQPRADDFQAEHAAVSEAYMQADNLDSNERGQLESVNGIFDEAALDNIFFSRMDCRTGYCRMEYTINEESDPLVLAVEENEMLLQLGSKYGDNATFHMVNTEHSQHVLFIELGDF